MKARMGLAGDASPMRGSGLPAAGSILLHGAVLAALIWRPAPLPAPPPPEQATIQVEFVEQSAQIKGVTANPAAMPEDASAPPEGEPATAIPPALPPHDSFADVPMPPDTPPAGDAGTEPGRQSNPAQRPSETGDGDVTRDAMKVTGRDIVSSGPDARFRNLPPHYPRAAMQQHQQGSVQVAVHITAAGLPDVIDMLISSGSAVLDQAVRDAVLKWHFKPAMRNGQAVASVYTLQMNFKNQEPQ